MLMNDNKPPNRSEIQNTVAAPFAAANAS